MVSVDLNGILYTVETSWCDEGHTQFILSIQYSQEKTWRVISLKKNLSAGLRSDICRPVSFKLGIMVEKAILYILISVWISLTFIQGNSCNTNQNYLYFFRKFAVSLDEIQYVATTCCFVEAHAKFILYQYYSRERGERIQLTWFYKICV